MKNDSPSKYVGGRKMVERLVQENEKRYRNLIEQSADGIIIVDQSGKVRFVNPAAEFIFDRKADELLDKIFGFTVMAGEVTEIDLIRRIGSTTTVEMRVVETEWEGEVAHLLSIRDITERKKMEKALRESEEKYRNLFEKAEVGMYQSRLDGSAILACNQKLADIFGISKEELMAEPTFIRWANPEKRAEMVEQLQEMGSLTDYEVAVITKSGEIKNVQISMKLYPEQGFLEGTVLDITDRKKTEEKLHHTLKELEARNKELDEYVYMMSHDLRTPLLNIQGFASLLKKKHGDELSETTRHYIDTVISGAKYLDTLLNDVLTLSRAGLSKLKLERIELLSAIQSCLHSLQTSIVEKKAEVLVPNKLPAVDYDPTCLKEVLTSILSNALQYSKKDRKPKIELRWEENRNENIISIKDNGVGINKKYLEKVFRAFERLSTDENGTGLGLSITKKIIERHGGRIWAKSKFGEGSTFYFTIPKVTKEAE